MLTLTDVSKQLCKLNLLILHSYCAGILHPLRHLLKYIFCLTIKNEFIFPTMQLQYDLKVLTEVVDGTAGFIDRGCCVRHTCSNLTHRVSIKN